MGDEIQNRVFRLISKVKRIPEEAISIDSTFEQLGLDSLDAVNLLYEIEGEFNCSVPDELVMAIKNVRQLIESLQKVLAGNLQSTRLEG